MSIFNNTIKVEIFQAKKRLIYKIRNEAAVIKAPAAPDTSIFNVIERF